MNKKWFHFLIFNLFGAVGLGFLIIDQKSFFTTVSISPLPELDFSVSLVLDEISYFFLFMSVGVSGLVFKYSYKYMEGGASVSKFLWTLFIFALSMFVLSVSSSLFWVMVGWDGLGLSSFCLILFFSSRNSFNSGMVTFINNRVGDLFILMSISFLFLGDCLIPQSSMNAVSWWVGIGVFVGALSKSAQVPFSAWLPLAMAAPTPVSSLVHSSTLVTAGLFLSSRFYPFLGEGVLQGLTFLSSVTLLLAGGSSLSEMDLKKIIALSTMSHVAFMFFFISLSDFKCAMTHMVAHAFFKSLLFMASGHVIHQTESQDIRSISFTPFPDPFFWVVFLISTMSMMGLPFLAGFYSKELCLAKLLSFGPLGLFYLFSFFSAVAFSVAYSLRILFVFFSKVGKLGPMVANVGVSGWKPVFYLGGVMSLVVSSVVLGLFTLSGEVFFDMEFKLFLLLSMVVGVCAGYMTSSGAIKLGPTFEELFYLSNLGLSFQPLVFKLSSFIFSKVDSKGLLDWASAKLEGALSLIYEGSKKNLFYSGGFLILFFVGVLVLSVGSLSL